MVLAIAAVRHAKPRAKNFTLPDFDGLAPFVNTKGTKSWYFRFSWAGKEPRISLGTYPEKAYAMLELCVISPGRWSRRVSIPAISGALSAMPNCWP